MTPLRRAALLAALAALLVLSGEDRSAAHAALRFSSPLDGATLGAPPGEIVLTFQERPDPALSTVHVVDTQGTAYEGERVEPVPGDPLSVRMPLRQLGRGVYTVNWRVMSAVDGHASAGGFVFGVLVAPTAFTSAPAAPPARLETAGRILLVAGFVLLLGASVARARGGTSGNLHVASAGWLLAVVGAAVLTIAQRRAAQIDLLQFARTGMGATLIERTIALTVAAAGIAVSLMAQRAERIRPARIGAAIAALAAIGGIVAHAAAGHAAGQTWARTAIGVQAVHFAAAGLWLGGLAALVAAMWGKSSLLRAEDVRRFSSLAGIALGVVLISGVLRTLHEVATLADLTSTGYGRVLSAKILFFVTLAMLGGWNRWRNVPDFASRPRALQRTAALELFVAVLTIVAAGVLASLPPPAAARPVPGIDASASDFATSVRVHLRAASDQPGPNRFDLEVVDYDSGDPVRDANVTLRFTPVDDPGVSASTLALHPSASGVYSGTGANLTFDGRWRILASIERPNGSVTAELPVEARRSPPFISVLRPPGRPASYLVEARRNTYINITPTPGRGGTNRLSLECLTGLMEPFPVTDLILVIGAGPSARTPVVTRTGSNKFVSDTELVTGANRISVVGHTPDGNRLRIAFDLMISP